MSWRRPGGKLKRPHEWDNSRWTLGRVRLTGPTWRISNRSGSRICALTTCICCRRRGRCTLLRPFGADSAATTLPAFVVDNHVAQLGSEFHMALMNGG